MALSLDQYNDLMHVFAQEREAYSRALAQVHHYASDFENLTSVCPVKVIMDTRIAIELNHSAKGLVNGEYAPFFDEILLYPSTMQVVLNAIGKPDRLRDMVQFALRHEEGHAVQRRELGLFKFLQLSNAKTERFANDYATRLTGFRESEFRRNHATRD